MIKKFAGYRRLPALGVLLLFALTSLGYGQSATEPTREELLNGLLVLYAHRPGDANVLLKLRLKSGAAFDLTGKGGTMALLGDALFPDQTTREYVSEQLGGKLDVHTSYDGIDVTISGRASELERIIELLRNALLNLNLSAENVTRLREARISRVSNYGLPSQIADRAIAARMFGSFPYGHPPEGTPETLARIQRADLMLAQERFFHADNAALVAIGGVEKARLLRALRQLIGPWQKSDRLIPATFRPPGPPDDRVLLINHGEAGNAEVRVALRGLARSDRDVLAVDMLAYIVRERWPAAVSNLSSVAVRHESHTLPGAFVLSAAMPTTSAAKAISGVQDILRSLAQNGPALPELERARSLLLAELGRKMADPSFVADAWLDAETYRVSSTSNPTNEISRISVADLQRVANRLFKDAPLAKVAVGNVNELKSALGTNVEIGTDKPEVKSAQETLTPSRKP